MPDGVTDLSWTVDILGTYSRGNRISIIISVDLVLAAMSNSTVVIAILFYITAYTTQSFILNVEKSYIHTYADVCVYVCVYTHAHMFILRKQKILGRCSILFGTVLFWGFVYYCWKLDIQVFFTERWKCNKLLYLQNIRNVAWIENSKLWHIHYYCYKGGLKHLSICVMHLWVTRRAEKNQKCCGTLPVVILTVLVFCYAGLEKGFLEIVRSVHDRNNYRKYLKASVNSSGGSTICHCGTTWNYSEIKCWCFYICIVTTLIKHIMAGLCI